MWPVRQQVSLTDGICFTSVALAGTSSSSATAHWLTLCYVLFPVFLSSLQMFTKNKGIKNLWTIKEVANILGGVYVVLSHYSASTRPNENTRPCIRMFLLSGIDQSSVCVSVGVFGICAWWSNSRSPFIFISVRHASVTLLRHCNRLHCSSLFRLSAHAWQFDCLSFPHRFLPIISALCVPPPPP